MTVMSEEITKEEMLTEILEGLTQSSKQIPSKYFYDEEGSVLFDAICELDEYYPTRNEMKIMSKNIKEISSLIGENALLIELGSGSSVKIRLLFEHLINLSGYIPIDISADHLEKSIECLHEDYPNIDIYPITADYTKDFNLPHIKKSYKRKVVFYPGSTIGNFTRTKAKDFLIKISEVLGERGGLLIGVDLKKDITILEAAYNDKKGITAAFNLNILNHLNNQLNTNFDTTKFEHYAVYNKDKGRIEMHLISKEKQSVKLNGSIIGFEKDENILTEYSNKYSIEEFKELISDKFLLHKVWLDEKKLFSLQYYEVK